MQVDPERTALIVVDMQRGFAHPDGALYAPLSESVIDSIAGFLDRSRAAGASVIFTRDVHPPEQFENAHYYDEFDRWGEHVVDGSAETAIVEGLTVAEDDHVVTKHTYDAFYQTELEGWLAAHGINDLLVCGTLANVCVLHTAASAGLRDFRPILIEDCIGAIEQSNREYALEHADWLFGEVCERAAIEFVE
jgi:nicotinamidase-related amidase